MYLLKLTKKQLQVASDAISLIGHVKDGNPEKAFDYLPYKEDADEKDIFTIKDIFLGFLKDLVVTGKTPSEGKFLQTLEIPLSKENLIELSNSCDLLARLYMGQIGELFDYLPLKENSHEEIWKIRDSLIRILPSVLIHGIDGYSSSLGVGSPDLHRDSNIAVDIHQVIRHKLSWEDAVAKGTVENEQSSRKWQEMMFVSYDTPFHWGSEPLVEIYKL